MIERRRMFFLLLIMTIVSLIVGGISITLLYRTALAEERARLVVTAQSQARLVEAIARFDKIHTQDYPGGPLGATLSQISDAHTRYAGFGETGEFTLARLDDDQIVFLLRHRHTNLDLPVPISFGSELAEPMRRALLGKSGTVIGLDYRGVQVLAAHEPLAELDLGIVAKIDLVEIQSPFIRAILIAGFAALGTMFVGALLFFRVSEPMLKKLSESEARYRNLFESVPVGINRTTPDGKILDANQALINLLKYPDKESLLAVNVIDLYENPQDRVQWQELMVAEKMLQGFEVEFCQYDGTVIWIQSNTQTIVNEMGQVQYYEGSLEDITERKIAVEELDKYRVHLEEMVEQRTNELQEKMDEQQKFLNLMAGREVRMGELKRVITKLRKQLKGNDINPIAFDPLLGPDDEW
jgi:PAS domain S-box-containing protein